MPENVAPKKKQPAAAPSEWFVRMSNGSVFGPINTKGLVFWASDGRILPDDEVSPNRVDWFPARELPELRMDTMIERPDGTFMGPFNAQAIQPLITEGKIPPKSKQFPLSELDDRMASRQMALFGDEALPARQDGVAEGDPDLHQADDPAWVQAAFEERIDALRREAEDKVAEQIRILETVTAERDTLKAELAAHTTSSGQVKALNRKAAELTAERDALKAGLAAQTASSEQVGTLNRKAAELTAERDALKAKYEALARERLNLEQKLAEAEAGRRQNAEAAERGRTEAAAHSAELQEEYNELLAFSNARDGESKARIRALEAELGQLKEAAESRGLVPLRRLEELESRMMEAIKERDLLREKLADAGAKAAISGHPVEGDIAIVKMFAEGALDLMQKTLEQEKARNMAARAASVKMQQTIHTEVERLARVLARDPGEVSRSEQMEQRAEHQIARLQQELESDRRHHQADMARAEANEKAMEGRCKALSQKESLLREKLSRMEQRAADYDSLSSQLSRKERALLAAEKDFEEARQQWQLIQSTLQHRLEDLERGAGLLFDPEGQSRSTDAERPDAGSDSKMFRVEPWMRRMKRK